MPEPIEAVYQRLAERFPELRRECLDHGLHWNQACGDKGWLPDITLEKVHAIFWGMCDRITYLPNECRLDFHHKESVVGMGKDDLEAAARALDAAAGLQHPPAVPGGPSDGQQPG